MLNLCFDHWFVMFYVLELEVKDGFVFGMVVVELQIVDEFVILVDW